MRSKSIVRATIFSIPVGSRTPPRLTSPGRIGGGRDATRPRTRLTISPRFARTISPSSRLVHSSISFATPRAGSSAYAASPHALIAPTEVPESTSIGSGSPIAFPTSSKM